MFTPVKFQTRLLLGSWKICTHVHVRGHIVRERWVAIQMQALFFGDAPITPACEVPAWSEMQMAPHVCCELMKQLNSLDWLKERKHHGAVVLAHHDLSGAAKGGAHRD